MTLLYDEDFKDHIRNHYRRFVVKQHGHCDDDTPDWKVIALARKFNIELRDPETYTIQDVMSFKDEDLERMILASDRGILQKEEFRYFFCDSLPHLILQQRMAQYKKREVIDSWQKAKDRNLLHYYFNGQGDYGYQQLPVIPEIIKYSGDMEEYKRLNMICSWQQAENCNRLQEYFSGIGFFPKVSVDKKVFLYSNDYQDFIQQLPYERYLEFLSRYAQPFDDKYEDPTTFVRKAKAQISDYVRIIEKLPSPIYIPGDGIGVGSYCATICGKEYYSSEPNPMGKDAILMGLITSNREYNVGDAQHCASVFFGNMIHLVDFDIRSFSEDVVIAIYDERGFVQSMKGDYFSKTCFYPGHTYREWFTRDLFPAAHKSYFKRDIQDIIFPVDQKAEAMVLYDLILPDVLHCHKSFRDIMYEYRGFSNRIGKMMSLYLLNYYGFLRYCRNHRKDLLAFASVLGKRVFFVTSKEISDRDEVFFHYGSRSFLNDNTKARVNQYKNLYGQVIPYSEFIGIYTDKGYMKAKIKENDRIAVLENYTVEGEYFIATVGNPYAKHFVKIGREKMRIVLVDFNNKTRLAKYKYSQYFSYTNASQEILGELI